ncbi:DNA repair protein RadC [Pseudomonas sp. WN033]|nr:DNA repair protein RadC [Pseudomonas sp. WN033]
MTTYLSVQDSAKLFKVPDTQHEDWIIARAMEIMERRIFRRGQALCAPDTVKNFLRGKLVGQRNEVFAALFLDSQHQLLAYEELFKGTIDEARVYPRVVLTKALEYNAAAVIFAHNHPSGTTEPSHADRALTARLKAALAPVDIRMLDHLIIGQGQPFSFAETGLI